MTHNEDNFQTMHDSRDKESGVNSESITADVGLATTNITSFSVALEKQIELQQKKGIKSDFQVLSDRDILVTLATEQERWFFENVNTDILICEIAAKLRDSVTPVKISAIELLAIGREIGRYDRAF